MNDVPQSLCDERTKNISQKMEELAVSQHDTHQAVMDIRRLLLGNGERGLFERMRDCEEWQSGHKAAHANARKLVLSLFNSHSIWKLLAALLAGAGLGGVAALWG